MTERAELEAALARAHAAEAKVEALEIRLGMRPAKPGPREVAKPARFIVQRGADDLAITWRWSPDWFLAAFTLVWNAFLIFTFIDAGGELIEAGPKILLVLPFVLVGFWIARLALASFINRTTIRTRDRLLEVVRGPIALGKRRYAVAANDIQQLHAVRKANDEGTVPFSLIAVLGDDRQRTLVEDLTDDESRFLEVAFEEHLGIENKPLAPD